MPSGGAFGGITLVRVAGIPVRVHWTLLVVLPLFAWFIAAGTFPAPGDGAVDARGLALGGTLAVLLFVSVTLHEFGHALVARRLGVPVSGITLLPIGGVTSMEEDPKTPGRELAIAAAGPLVSFALGFPILAVALAGLVPEVTPGATRLVQSLGFLNVVLGAFNLFVPAFPMDGGRVLRALLAFRLPALAATKWAARVGRVFAFAMAGVGFVTFTQGGWTLLLIAFLVYAGATQEESSMRAKSTLGDLEVDRIMTREVALARPDDPVHRALDVMFETRHVVLPVADDGRPVGVVGLHDLAKVTPLERDALLVRDVMRADFASLPLHAPAADALRLISREGKEPVLVLAEDGHLAGLVSRTDLVRAIDILEVDRTAGLGPSVS
ncbi:MAG TPA: site-2 protease family protein [Candidatus Thermoplasmatota archaeon]|nr:site-2 protease family protein [Candidatus Thermoplasmatota archaeon]